MQIYNSSYYVPKLEGGVSKIRNTSGPPAAQHMRRSPERDSLYCLFKNLRRMLKFTNDQSCEYKFYVDLVSFQWMEISEFEF